MANGYVVTTVALRRTAQELRDLNSQYRTRVESLAGLEQELRSMWEGEANIAFQHAFASDKVNLDNFYSVIERYVQALETAAAEYEKAEAQATQTATTRTYR